MKIKRVSEDAEIEFQHDELLVLNAALNEVCNGIDMSEFETRVGASRKRVESLMREIQSVLDQIEKR